MGMSREDSVVAALATVAIALPMGSNVEGVAIQRALATAIVVAWLVLAYCFVRTAFERGALGRPYPRRSEEPFLFWASLATVLLIWLVLLVVFCGRAWIVWFELAR